MRFPLSKFLAIALLLSACAATPNVPPPSVQSSGYAPGLVAENTNVVTRGEIPTTAAPVKIALLLPLSGDSATVGNAMLDAATMALSDTYLTLPSNAIRSKVILLPKDAGATPADAAIAAQAVIDQGATFIIGPLFSQSVAAITPIAKAHNVPILSFSNTKAIAGDGVYVFGFLPEQQVMRVAEYAYLHNLQRVAVLAPNDAYGQKIKETVIQAYSQKGGVASPSELYAPTQANIDAAVARMASSYNNVAEEQRFKGIFVADGGTHLKQIIDALKKNHIDLKKVKLLGTGLWDDPNITKIPEMSGSWFTSSPPAPYQVFERHFFATYHYKPIRLASLAYDAVTVVAGLTLGNAGTPPSAAALTNPEGFNSPANGMIRLHTDGTSDRKLAIMEVTPAGFKVIDPAMKNF